MDYSKVFILKTFMPGWKKIDISLDPEYQKLLEAQKNGTLRNMFPDAHSRVNRHATNFHDNDMLFENYSANKIKSELVTLEVPEFLEDGTPNEEGVVILENEVDVIYIMNDMIGRGIKPILERYGRQLTDKSKESLVEAVKNDGSRSSECDLVHPAKKADGRKAR
jgi:hypothetical protein